MIEFTLNDEPINFTLNAETEGVSPSGPYLMGDTTILWGDTTITFND